MAKRSKRRTSRLERDQAGCISGIINMFQFRQGRATKRLLSDSKQMSNQAAVGAVAVAENSSDNTISPSPTEICERLEESEESKMPMTDANKTSVQELMEEEMFNEKGLKQSSDSGQVTMKSGNTKKKHQKKKRSSSKSSDMDFDRAHEQIQLGNNLDLERIVKELDDISKRLNTNCSKHDFDLDIDEEKLLQAVKLFIEQKLNSDNNCCSEELIMEALQTLSLNKGLFLKLLQDPNSELFKHVQGSEEARLGKEKPVNLKPGELSSHKNQNLFTRRTKSLESYRVGENNKDCQSPSKIVILIPGLEQSSSLETNIPDNYNTKVQLNEKNVSQFSFTEIKRKLKHAMGKEKPPLRYPPKTQNSNSTSEKGENFGWRSPNRNHFYTERFTLSSPSLKKGEPVGKLKDCSEKSNVYIEAKKHLADMVKSGDENTVSTYGNNPVKPLGRILSLPEYNGSPCPSPRKPGDDIFLTAQVRLSPRGTVKDNPRQRMQNSDRQPCISSNASKDKVQSLDANDCNLLGDDKKYSLEIECFNEDAIVSEVQPVVAEIEQTNELKTLEETNVISVDTREIDIEERASKGFILHLSQEDQELSSPAVSPPYDREKTEIEDSDRAMEKIEQPSPISVLEPLLTNDDMSPASTISQPVEKEVQPRHIHFEEEQPSSIHDQGICTRISMEDEESAFEYIEAVLLSSDLNWDEFLLRWVCAFEILDQSLFEEVKLFSSRPLHDQKLLFDCANETLKEICECYFGCFAQKNKTNSIRRAPKGMDLINDVWGRVEWHLSQNLQSRSLDQLVRKDLAGSKEWMNIRLDMEIIVLDMEESIFAEMVEEIVRAFGVVDL